MSPILHIEADSRSTYDVATSQLLESANGLNYNVDIAICFRSELAMQSQLSTADQKWCVMM